MSSLTCPICSDIAVERDDDIWQEDEELDCPCCAAHLIVMMSEDEVWLEEVDL